MQHASNAEVRILLSRLAGRCLLGTVLVTAVMRSTYRPP